MRTLCKKALALCLVAALALTCFVGTLSVSAAETYNATITVADVVISTPAETATAVLNISIPEGKAGINEAIFDIYSTIGSASDVKLTNSVVDAGTAEVEGTPVDDTTTNYNRFILSAYKADDATELNGITSATIEVTFAVAETAVAGKYPITIDVSKVRAADKDEVVINLVYEKEAKFIIKCDDGAHTYGNTVVGTPATCGAAGAGTQECSVCGDVKEVVIDATGEHSYTYAPAEAGKHSVDCPNCDTVFDAETCVDENQDKSCDKCNADLTEDEPECEHQNATKTVTTQPTKDAEGLMTYTCECGHSWTEAIAMPKDYGTDIMFNHDLSVRAVVADNISLSTKHIREKIGADYTYFIHITYQKYGNGHMLQPKEETLTSEKRLSTSTANKDVFTFADIALNEMTVAFDATVYFVNAEGVVTGYENRNLSIASIALAYCEKYSSNTKLLTALADMCKYGDELQNYFAAVSPNSDIANAVLPSAILGETYMANASSTEGMPAAGEYNNELTSSVLADGITSSGFVSTSQSLSIGATNQIYYRIRKDDYAFEDIEIKLSYFDELAGDTQEFVVAENELIEDGLTGAGKMKYKYYFCDLPLYACDKTVTMEMYHNGVLEMTSTYSIGNFVNANINNPTFTNVLTALELFSNSVGVQLTLDSRW